MRDISVEEHKELMAFLSNKATQLYAHEVEEAIRAGREPKNAFQGIFALPQCMAYERNGITIYFVYTKAFLKFARHVLPEITKNDPNVFRTRDAREIIDMLYDISGYGFFRRSREEYQKYIADEACVYIILKENDTFDETVLRIDLCRQLIAEKLVEGKWKYGFQGGLLHAAKHFRIEDSMTIDSLYDLEHMVWICSNAFLKILTNNRQKYTICLPYDNKHSFQIGFYREVHTNVYYIDTLYPIRNSTIETFSENDKFGLKNKKGGVVVPCKYDEIKFDERTNCYVCKRDGVFFESGYKLDPYFYTGVTDLYATNGEFLIGGFSGWDYIPTTKIFLFRFGGIWNEGYNGHYTYGDRYAKWVMLKNDMTTVWDNRSFRGMKIKLDEEHNTEFPEKYTFFDYEKLNDNQILITKDVDYVWPECTKFQIVFINERVISEESSWFYPISTCCSIYQDSHHLLGVISGERKTRAVYDYISLPHMGWCLGLAHEESNAQSKNKKGYCALINTHDIDAAPIILYKDMDFYALEEYVKNNWALMCQLDEAENCVDVLPVVSIPEHLYKSTIVNPAIRDKVICGESLKDIENKIKFVSAKYVEKDKENYVEKKYPRPNYNSFSDRVSPLDAFEGDEELYNEWLINS